MWITGYTSSRLGEVKTLDKNNPYKVGVKGVFNVQPDFIEYELDGILYKTTRRKSFGEFRILKGLGRYPTSYIEVENLGKRVDTIFRVEKTEDSFEYKPLIKEEEKLEQVFLPEIDAQIFIERESNNIYEKHMRLMDINNIGQLETYKNGFYNIKKER
jgi:hypothetical protein